MAQLPELGLFVIVRIERIPYFMYNKQAGESV